MKRVIVIGFIVVSCFLLSAFFIRRIDPFEHATTKINTWSPEMRLYFERETGISFPSDEAPVYFEYEKLLDYQAKMVFFMSKSELVLMIPNDVIAKSKEYDSAIQYEKRILSDKEISDNSPIDYAIRSAKRMLMVEHYPLEKSQEKPVLFNLEIYLPDVWQNVEASEKVLVVMQFFET